ncbi:MAG: hypothetical protein IPJ38_18855 [Dechloromonas sp.]|uniref:Uncharacterized protein n=1 Tax=Candidatus Dechloromonas phosphorivorans TaxID=2899244 RepID=A0A935KCD7_9RHOO|nr:hypothetical protein [Candidatus Dechloromonas phosphorivorans]
MPAVFSPVISRSPSFSSLSTNSGITIIRNADLHAGIASDFVTGQYINPPALAIALLARLAGFVPGPPPAPGESCCGLTLV